MSDTNTSNRRRGERVRLCRLYDDATAICGNVLSQKGLQNWIIGTFVSEKQNLYFCILDATIMGASIRNIRVWYTSINTTFSALSIL